MKSDILNKIRAAFTIVIATTMVIGGTMAYKYSQDLQAEQEKYDFMQTTNFNVGLRLPYAQNPIAVILNDFSEYEKSEITKSVEALDEILDSFEYDVYHSNDVSIKQKIYIQKVSDIEKISGDKTSLALTSLTYNNSTGVISYPITIYVDDAVMNYYDEHGVSLLSYVIKHEMMHTLGFADIYSEERKSDTIMYYDISNNLNDFTEQDKINLKEVYDKHVKVVRPDEIAIVPPKQEQSSEQEQEEDMSR